MGVQIQRVAEHKDGWKLRFGDANGLIATVVVSDKGGVRLPTALRKGLQVAEVRLAVMRKFNQEQQ